MHRWHFIVAGQHREIVYNSVSSRLKFYGWFPQNNTSIFKQEKLYVLEQMGFVVNEKCGTLNVGTVNHWSCGKIWPYHAVKYQKR